MTSGSCGSDDDDLSVLQRCGGWRRNQKCSAAKKISPRRPKMPGLPMS